MVFIENKLVFWRYSWNRNLNKPVEIIESSFDDIIQAIKMEFINILY